MKLLFETKIDRPFLEIKSKFNLDLFVALKPPVVNLAVKRFDGCSPGHEVHLDLPALHLKAHQFRREVHRFPPYFQRTSFGQFPPPVAEEELSFGRTFRCEYDWH